MTLSLQWITLIAVAGAGMGMALTYDLYAWFRRRLRLPALVVFLFDLLYWAFFALAFILLLFYLNDGRFRFVLFAILALGSYLYFLLFSAPVLALWEWIVDRFLSAFRGLYALLRFLWRFLFTLLLRPLFVLGKAVFRGISFLFFGFIGLLLFFFRQVWKSLYAFLRFPVKIILELWGRLKGR